MATVQPISLKTDSVYKSHENKPFHGIAQSNSQNQKNNVSFGNKIPYLGLRIITGLMFVASAIVLAAIGYHTTNG